MRQNGSIRGTAINQAIRLRDGIGGRFTPQVVSARWKTPPLLNGATEAQAATTLSDFDDLDLPAGTYWFSPPGAATMQLDYEKDLQSTGVGWVKVFSSPYASTATLNLLGQDLPITQFMVRRSTGDVYGTAGWNDGTYRRFNARTTTGDVSTTGTLIGYRVFFGSAGGHGIYNSVQTPCQWPNVGVGPIGAGWDGSTCGSYPDSLRWGTAASGTPTYANRSGTYEIWLRW